MAHKTLNSAANQPDRLFLDSSMVVLVPESLNEYPTELNQASYEYNSLNFTLKQPILACKGVCLSSFTQVNNAADGPCIPDYIASDCGFLYYKYADGESPDTTNLKVVALDPTYDMVTAVGAAKNKVNRYFTSFSDFVDCLNAAAVDANAPNPADIVFDYDSATRQIVFSGADTTKNYLVAGYNDDAVRNYFDTTSVLSQRNPVPYGNTLNTRIGYTNAVYNLALAKKGGMSIRANGYPNLVRTDAVFLRANFTGVSSLNTAGKRDVIATCSINVPFLGINTYIPYTTNYLSDIPDNIQFITISFFDDAGQPYPVHNNVSTSLELLLRY